MIAYINLFIFVHFIHFLSDFFIRIPIFPFDNLPFLWYNIDWIIMYHYAVKAI